jgi:hypothetical protein
MKNPVDHETLCMACHVFHPFNFPCSLWLSSSSIEENERVSAICTNEILDFNGHRPSISSVTRSLVLVVCLKLSVCAPTSFFQLHHYRTWNLCYSDRLLFALLLPLPVFKVMWISSNKTGNMWL